MRVLRFIFTAFILFCVVIVAGFFLSREVLLFWGTSKIRNSLRTLSLALQNGSYTQQCLQLGSTPLATEPLVTYQLRFLSSSEFVSEAVCAGFPYEPIRIAQDKLPEFVTKVPGSSGFFVERNTQSGIQLTVFEEEIDAISEAIDFELDMLRRNKPLIAEGGVLIKDPQQTYVGTGPTTQCEGYGYECCDTVAQFGVGDRITGLTDCEKTCFAQCASRPLVLSFNTNPIMNPNVRTVTVETGTTVEFTYVADAGEADSVTGILDFGDGDKTPVSGLASQTSHTYECPRARCSYTAKLTLTDNWGVNSAELGISQVTIVVTR